MPIALTPGGTEIAFTAIGTGPPDLVFLHGLFGSAAYFRESCDALDFDHARAIAVDLSGHGDSPPAECEWSLDEIDDAVLAASDTVGARRIVAIGFSAGAKFALHLAVTHPDRVAALVLVAGTPAGPIPLPAELIEDWKSRVGDASAIRDLVTPYLTGPVDKTAFERFAENAARVPLSALEGTLRATLDTDFQGSLSSIDVPTLVVGGTLDTLFTPELLREALVEPIACARLALIDCGHEIPLERPHQFAAVIEAFLAGLHEDGHGGVQLSRSEEAQVPVAPRS
jgi:pimeloyl-ACP methyl ester carboxylesterase